MAPPFVLSRSFETGLLKAEADLNRQPESSRWTAAFNYLKSQHCRAKQETYNYQFPSPYDSLVNLSFLLLQKVIVFHDTLHLGQPCHSAPLSNLHQCS